MKKTIVVMAVMAAFAACAETYWAAVNTDGARGDTSGDTTKYEAFYCTVAAAEQMFGASDIAGVTSYLRANYDTGMTALRGGGTKMTEGIYGLGLYTFSLHSDDPMTTFGSQYLAVVAYSNGGDMFRVFGNDSGATADGNIFFSSDPKESSGGAGAWTTVPEPTSGLLLLLGSALLALRRKRT